MLVDIFYVFSFLLNINDLSNINDENIFDKLDAKAASESILIICLIKYPKCSYKSLFCNR